MYLMDNNLIDIVEGTLETTDDVLPNPITYQYYKQLSKEGSSLMMRLIRMFWKK